MRAHRGSLGYRARKFLRRNWAPSLAVLAMIVASAYYVVELAEKNRRIGEYDYRFPQVAADVVYLWPKRDTVNIVTRPEPWPWWGWW